MLTSTLISKRLKAGPEYKKERHEGRFRPKKPDKDNIEKIYFDAMNGMIWGDDNQVIDGRTRKFYSMKPRTVIRIKELEGVQ